MIFYGNIITLKTVVFTHLKKMSPNNLQTYTGNTDISRSPTTLYIYIYIIDVSNLVYNHNCSVQPQITTVFCSVQPQIAIVVYNPYHNFSVQPHITIVVYNLKSQL